MTGRVVLVVGPPLAGVGGVVAGLASALPDHVVTEPVGLAAHGPPDVVLVVVSAVAPMTRTDWHLAERAAEDTHLVIGVVTKIDAHRRWRAVLAANRASAAGWCAGRPPMPWVGVAAAPNLGEPDLVALVDLLAAHLAEPDLDARKELHRSMVRRRRSGPGPAAVELKGELLRARLRLVRFVRERGSSLRAELREEASAVTRGGTGRFEARVREAAALYLRDVDAEIMRVVAEHAVDERRAAGSPTHPNLPPELSRPSTDRRLEGRLMAVLGVGFGLGIALAGSRLAAGMGSGPSLLGVAAGFAIGLALVVWVVRTRALLHERALLDRWVTEVTAALRWHGESVVVERLHEAEVAWARQRAGPRRLSG